MIIIFSKKINKYVHIRSVQFINDKFYSLGVY